MKNTTDKEIQEAYYQCLVNDHRAVNVEVPKLSWVLQYTDLDPDRVTRADTTVPVLVYLSERKTAGSLVPQM